GPTSSTTSCGSSAASAAIRRTVPGSTTKFCPSRLDGRTPSRPASSLISPGVSSRTAAPSATTTCSHQVPQPLRRPGLRVVVPLIGGVLTRNNDLGCCGLPRWGWCGCWCDRRGSGRDCGYLHPSSGVQISTMMPSRSGRGRAPGLPGAEGALGGGGYRVAQVGQVQALDLGQAAQGVGGQGGLVGLAAVGDRGEERRVGLGQDEVGRGGRGGVP